eukprot:6492792-Amphidinium_carterae.1
MGLAAESTATTESLQQRSGQSQSELRSQAIEAILCCNTIAPNANCHLVPRSSALTAVLKLRTLGKDCGASLE